MGRRLKIKFTDEHLALINNLYFGEIFVSHPEQSLDMNVRIIDGKLNDMLSDVKDKHGIDLSTRDEISVIKGQLFKISEASAKSRIYADTDDKAYFGIDTYNMFGGGNKEEIARIIGCYDKVIKGTEEDFDGPKFPKEVNDHIKDVYFFVFDNLTTIEEIIHQRCTKGGIKSDVTYVAYDNERIWMTEEEFEERRKNR